MTHHPIRLALLALALVAALRFADAGEVTLYTSPNGGARAAVIATLDAAETEVLVFAYALTSDRITDAILRAQRRGCKCHILADRMQAGSRYSTLPRLAAECSSVALCTISGYQHAKTLVVDRRWVLTGSYNWTDRAETHNVEHLLVLDNPELACSLREHFRSLPTRPLRSKQTTPPTPASEPCYRCTPPLHNPSLHRRTTPWSESLAP